jgi:hypothetical protein
VDFLMQTLNYRNRSPLLTDSHAGNYENVLGYDGNGYATAGGVRKSLLKAPYGNIAKMPDFCSIVRMAFYTSWIFKDTPLPSFEGCNLELHLPIMQLQPDQTKALDSPLDVGITFRCNNHEIAFICFCGFGSPDGFDGEKSVLGDSLSRNIFAPV